MADRGLAHRRGIRYVVDHEGDVVVRMNLVSIPLESSEAEVFELLPRLRELDIGEARDWPVHVRDEQGTLPVRVCALKKSKEQVGYPAKYGSAHIIQRNQFGADVVV